MQVKKTAPRAIPQVHQKYQSETNPNERDRPQIQAHYGNPGGNSFQNRRKNGEHAQLFPSLGKLGKANLRADSRQERRRWQGARTRKSLPPNRYPRVAGVPPRTGDDSENPENPPRPPQSRKELENRLAAVTEPAGGFIQNNQGAGLGRLIRNSQISCQLTLKRGKVNPAATVKRRHEPHGPAAHSALTIKKENPLHT